MPGIEFGASVTSGGNNFNEFPDNWPNFVYLLVDPGFYLPSLKFLNFFLNWSIAVYSPIGWTPVTDTTDRDKWTDGRMDGQSRPLVRPSLRWSLTHTSRCHARPGAAECLRARICGSRSARGLLHSRHRPVQRLTVTLSRRVLSHVDLP